MTSNLTRGKHPAARRNLQVKYIRFFGTAQ